MKSRQWIKFCLDDWASDPSLVACSLAAQGLWLRMMRLAHRGEPYGHIRVNGQPMGELVMARLLGIGADEMRPLISELENNGVFSRDEDGAIYSRRMVRDSKDEDAGRKNGKHGGNPSLINCKQGLTPPLNPDRDFGLTQNREEKRREEGARSISPLEQAATVALQYYHDRMVELHNVKPIVLWKGADRQTAKTLLDGQPENLEDTKKLIDLYLKLADQEVREKGYPFGWLPSRAAGLRMPRRVANIPPRLE